MEQKVKLTYITPKLQIGIANWRTVYSLSPKSKELKPKFYKGRLIYREKGSAKKISYTQIKKGLGKQAYWITIEVPSWVF